MAKRKTKFIHKPVYPGGKTALRQFLQKNIRYPDAAKAAKTEGTVKVEYSLNQTGKVMRAKAVSGPKDGCREEAERLVKLLRFDVPKDYKMSVRYHQHLNITFKLPKEKPQPAPAATQLRYTITPSKTTQVKKESPQQDAGGYGYTIRW
ncbi:MAG: TonB family protein [Bacteroidota bacterium]